MLNTDTKIWQFSESRLLGFSGIEGGPSTQNEGNNDTTNTPQPSSPSEGPDIQQPPTEQVGEENVGTEQQLSSKQSDSSKTLKASEGGSQQGLTSRDIMNMETAKKNIGVGEENMRGYHRDKEFLQSRLQEWAKVSVSKMVDYVQDGLTRFSKDRSRDLELQTRLLQASQDQQNALEERFISFFDQKAQLSPGDPRFDSLREQIRQLVREGNRTLAHLEEKAGSLRQAFVETDIDLDEKKGEYTQKFDDPIFTVNDASIQQQFEDGSVSQHIAQSLVRGLKYKGTLTGLLDGAGHANLEFAEREAQNAASRMSPEQRVVFAEWLSKKIAESGKKMKVSFVAGGELKVEKIA